MTPRVQKNRLRGAGRDTSALSQDASERLLSGRRVAPGAFAGSPSYVGPRLKAVVPLGTLGEGERRRDRHGRFEMTIRAQHPFGDGRWPGWVSIYLVNQDWLVDVDRRYPCVINDLLTSPFRTMPLDRAEQLDAIDWLRQFCRRWRVHSDLVLKAAYSTLVARQRDPNTRGHGDACSQGSRWIFPDIIMPIPPGHDPPPVMKRQEWMRVRDLRWMPAYAPCRWHVPWLTDLTVGFDTQTSQSVAAAARTTRQNVDARVKELADVLGVRLPTRGRGRPRQRP
jgi:hypothetical protein